EDQLVPALVPAGFGPGRVPRNQIVDSLLHEPGEPADELHDNIYELENALEEHVMRRRRLQGQFGRDGEAPAPILSPSSAPWSLMGQS
ncbi:unnamed protein product, partial [Amoebophrya sp. A25]